MQKIVTFLWFDHQAQEAAEYYVSVFKDSRITDIRHYTDAGPGVPGSVMVVSFVLEGQEFMALNGGPEYPMTPAISLWVNCDDQEEVDRMWSALSDGGEEGPCGWLKDRYGLSWQIVPTTLLALMRDPDPERRRRTMEAMLKMGKLDVAALEDAAS